MHATIVNIFLCVQNVNLSLKISYNHACGKDKGGCDSEKDCKNGLRCGAVFIFQIFSNKSEWKWCKTTFEVDPCEC